LPSRWHGLSSLPDPRHVIVWDSSWGKKIPAVFGDPEKSHHVVEEKEMKTNQTKPGTVDEYIAGFPREVQQILEKIRATVRRAAPGAEETISYRIPSYTLKGKLVYFAGFKKHIGFYPRVTGISKFKRELSKYEGAKGSVKFPLEMPVPLSLIRKIVKFRVKENLERAKGKKK
jgi:uncharacterized protein YdhG (YjbR/CyaY superfamily)